MEENGDFLLTIPSIKTEEIEIKSEETYTGALPDEILCDDIKSEQNEEGDTLLHRHDGLIDTETEAYTFSENSHEDFKIQVNQTDKSDKKSKYQGTQTNVQIYECEKCEHKCKSKRTLRRHKLTHRNPSKVQIYNCTECEFKTTHKRHHTRHQRLHKDTYKCYNCIYETRKKVCLISHMLTHKDHSQVHTYKCDECKFETKYKSSLTGHQLTHKDLSELRLYACDKCDYRSTARGSLRRHQLRHMDPGDVRTYNCDKCEYRTPMKSHLKRHVLVHRITGMQVYKCDKCEYQSTCLSYLRQHQSTYKHRSEARTYKCADCGTETKYKQTFLRHQYKHRKSSGVQVS